MTYFLGESDQRILNGSHPDTVMQSCLSAVNFWRALRPAARAAFHATVNYLRATSEFLRTATLLTTG